MMSFAQSLSDAHSSMRRGDMAAALTAAGAATRANPHSAEAWWVLGSAASNLDDMTTAQNAFGKAAKWAPEGSKLRGQMLALRCKPLMSEGRMADAVQCARDAMAARIDDVPSLVRVGYTLTHAGLTQEALAPAQEATRLDPNHAEAWYTLGGVQRSLGDVPGAEASFNNAIRLSPTPPVAAYFNLAYLRRWKAEDNHIPLLEALTCRTSLEACRVAYTLFKEHDDIGETAQAWDCLQVGAELGRKIEPWTSVEEAESIAAWKQYFPAERFGASDKRRRSGPKRIFIIGLPRSGTTLIERVLAAHSQVQAIGELKSFGIAVHKLAGIDNVRRLAPEVIAAAAKLDPLDIAEFYTRESAFLNDGSAYVIDKLPSNHEYAGLIKLAFPDAIVVALDRNPMDALFGCYKVLFTGAYGWSYGQDDLADHYHHFRDLMGYWKSVLGEQLIEVSLEAVIADPEAQIRRLIAACGLDFEEACLKPHEASGAVSTASAVQVRSPINSQGVNAWKRYEAPLAPLQARLRQMGYVE
ncbi:hypothetical protein ABAC460_12525 [Asticcacaulis sp. AC460]|uniref:tetratricopeptide repeat-containing sulfotransferase family protein n=1 Tax=Asticcacaulis sp. AC460 TaxID=1282360 RepID=UPI0003C3F50C|nr:sulfotransferase [Asticcacaulis sp. AC460]ESQ89687.1 hypothetical protein ABAC460_12525 [Asticcacaulis sp. AC460]